MHNVCEQAFMHVQTHTRTHSHIPLLWFLPNGRQCYLTLQCRWKDEQRHCWGYQILTHAGPLVSISFSLFSCLMCLLFCSLLQTSFSWWAPGWSRASGVACGREEKPGVGREAWCGSLNWLVWFLSQDFGWKPRDLPVSSPFLSQCPRVWGEETVLAHLPDRPTKTKGRLCLWGCLRKAESPQQTWGIIQTLY